MLETEVVTDSEDDPTEKISVTLSENTELANTFRLVSAKLSGECFFFFGYSIFTDI